MVFDLLRKRIGKPGETAHLHPHREILPFHVASADVLRVGFANLGFFFAAVANGWAVPLLAFRIVSVDLNEHGIVDLFTEPVSHGGKVGPESVGSQLNAIGETAREILDEFGSATNVTASHQPRANQLGIGVQRYPGPHVATNLLCGHRGRNVLLLGSDEGPNLIALNPLAGQIYQGPVEVFRTGRAKFNQQFRNRVLRNSGHADRRANRVAFHQSRYDLRPLCVV